MRVVKKINNNVAICVDSKNKELIAFGKGIGFPAMPYELSDLSLISMTFYRIDSSLYNLIGEIPENIFEVSALLVHKAQSTLKCNLNPNLVVGLADHINFAIMRMKKYKKMQMLFSYDVEQLYPKETELGRYAIKLIQEKLYVKLPDSEITSIAMHFVNAEEEKEPEEGPDTEALIEEAAYKIESFFSVSIDRNGFNYNRFAMHFRYYLKRIKEKKQFMDDNTSIIEAMKEKYPKVYECAYMIGNFIDEKLGDKSSENEILYLMMHISRMINNIIIKD
ncbi:PRD domain-containing protein [Clostridium sp. SYSU_GA19001]|uniref:PRD domain-containing protein n=1 Tax=Clostridium caldaquaticum TaxID=2940653 RepID=UPI00207792B5|nr:PRD domain-containing protein [Clostridium caldaquaticum]MCM8711900.1 PRD domain-containing protein [Clostridium caldaquaticum]